VRAAASITSIDEQTMATFDVDTTLSHTQLMADRLQVTTRQMVKTLLRIVNGRLFELSTKARNAKTRKR
jgi:hypothetical protein